MSRSAERGKRMVMVAQAKIKPSTLNPGARVVQRRLHDARMSWCRATMGMVGHPGKSLDVRHQLLPLLSVLFLPMRPPAVSTQTPQAELGLDLLALYHLRDKTLLRRVDRVVGGM